MESHKETEKDIASPALGSAQTETQPAKKKKRRGRPKSKHGKNKPTGFEDYYVDTPITAEEYEVERELYNVSRPIIHRMEDALLRYLKCRRLENERMEVFRKYLIYGGVDVGPNMFAGTDNRDLQEMDSEQILIARGQTAISRDHSDLIIDFDAVVKGFLTSFFPDFFMPETEDMIKLATTTIRNFLSYLLYHDVCPEYKDNIDAARKSCDIAAKELWKNQQLVANAPGEFNTACATLFGGFQHDLYVEDTKWINPVDGSIQMPGDAALKVVQLGVCCAASREMCARFSVLRCHQRLWAKKLQDVEGFEVTDVLFPTDIVHEYYKERAPDLNPIGILHGRVYRDPAHPAYDISPEERKSRENMVPCVAELLFYVEERLLAHCYVGQKIMASVWEMNAGFHYFEDITRAYSSIYTVLPNDLMMGWKKPRDVTAKHDEEETDAE